MYISRDEALRLLKQYLKSDKLVKHCLAVEAIMRCIARELGENEVLWGLTGLLHDIDYEVVGGDMKKHGVVSSENILKGKLPKEALDAIKAHNELTGFKCNSKLAYALKAADQISGLIIATALVMPSRKLSEVKVSSLMKKFKQKDFARRVRRDDIKLCERLGIPLEKFMELSLKALQEIHEDLGL
ncbi:MAG TPA: HDIG domain-containing protein [Desulfurococcales archaeon]|nr:HDIG domain-containing protein [Desulfurococcales archaeon]